MITATPLTEARLAHRVHHLAVSESGHIAAVSPEGAGTLLTPDHTTRTPFRVSADASDIALSPTGSLLAATARGKLDFISMSSFRQLHRLDDSFEASCFGPAGGLWSAARWDQNSVALEARAPGSWQVVARTELVDPFGDSSIAISQHPDHEHVAVLFAAGQDGQCLFWARREGSKVIAHRFLDLETARMPSFTPSGDRFLTIYDANELRLYEFPKGPLLGKMQWPFDDMDNQIGDFVSFAGATRALLSSTADRLYLVDLRKMAIADEVCVRGHEPRPTSEIHPKLRNHSGLCGDLAYFAPLPAGGFLSVHREPRLGPEGDRRDSILTWRVAEPEDSV